MSETSRKIMGSVWSYNWQTSNYEANYKNATIHFLLPMTYLSSLNCCLSFQDTRVPLRISNVTMVFALIKDCDVMAISTALTNPTKITANVSQSTSCAHLESASHHDSSVMEEKIAAMMLTKTTAVRCFGSVAAPRLCYSLVKANRFEPVLLK